jgi:O-antigen ligase
MAGPFQNRNTYASFVELFLPVLAWMAGRDRAKSWLWWIACAAMVASVFATGSRSGAAFVAAEAVLILLAVASRNRALAAALVATLVLAIAIAGWERLSPRIANGDLLNYRREIYGSALRMVGERPLLGFGLGTFQTAYPRFATFDAGRYVNHAHNDWIEWAAEGGIALPVSLAAVWAIALWQARTRPWALGIQFVFLHALVDYPLQRAGMAAWVWVFASLPPPTQNNSGTLLVTQSDEGIHPGGAARGNPARQKRNGGEEQRHGGESH